MKSQLTLVILIQLFVFSLSAQTYVDIPWREGVIIKKGEAEKGMIRLGGDLGAPWLNHSKVYFVPQENWIEGKRPKKKIIKEYLPDDIDGYKTHTVDREGNRIDMEFTVFEIMIMGALKKKKGNAFLEDVEKGAVDVYSYIPKPVKKIMTTQEERHKDGQIAINQSTHYLQKGEGELIAVVECDLVDVLSDCPEVVEKIKKEAYGFKPKSERTVRKGFGKFVANALGDNGLENNIINAVKDYNLCRQ